MKSWCWLLIPIAAFALLRLPMIVHSPGVQDEQWFAVPGWTVWNEGVPRIPYVPTRNRETLFQDADRCLMALPPALFYVQAPFHALFPPGYATARVPLFLGGIATIVITFGLARKMGASVAASVLAAGVIAIGRPLMFTATVARPDLLSAVCGWSSLWLLWCYVHDPRWRTLVASGLVCGLGGLFHPFALVFAMQGGVILLIAGAAWWRKLQRLAVFGGACGIAIALWAPLIVMYPSEFRSQFFANVLDRAGPGLPARLVWPWPSLGHHAGLLIEFAGPWQLAFWIVTLIAASITIWKTRPRWESGAGLAILFSSIYLTAVVAGIHPTKGYWIYPAVWIAAAGALVIDHMRWNRGVRFAAVTMIVSMLMLPGGGLRTTWIYLTHWGEPELHGPTFIAGVLDQLPREGLFLADLTYVYDCYLSGRTTMLAQDRKTYWGDRDLAYEALLLAWEGEDAQWASQYDGVLKQRYGSRQRPQTCFVDVYIPRETADE